MHFDVAISLPQEVASVTLVRHVVASALESFGLTSECVDDIQLALSEACANVVDHAATEDEYSVELHVDEQRCELRVRNDGEGFDVTGLAEEMPDPTSARGRGVAIMRAVMDRVDFAHEEEEGTMVRLVKALSIREGALLAELRDAAAKHA
jgi:serine/threonine-protein kinase RsbW